MKISALVVGEIYEVWSPWPDEPPPDDPPLARLRSKTRPYGPPFPMEVKGLCVIEYLLKGHAFEAGWAHRMPGGAPEDLVAMVPPVEGGFVVSIKPNSLHLRRAA